MKEATFLPDFGRGREVWETQSRLRWENPARTLFGITEEAAMERLLRDPEADPLNDRDVVALTP